MDYDETVPQVSKLKNAKEDHVLCDYEQSETYQANLLLDSAAAEAEIIAKYLVIVP